MRIIFAGTPEFAVPCLRAVITSSHNILAVYTQPDRPAGRGQQLRASPVKQLALTHQLEVRQPISLRDVAVQQELASLQPDMIVVVAYGLIMPPQLLTIPRFGCINVHASLLPRWRGAAPIQRAILAGDTDTGITIMQMDVGLDTGTMLYQQAEVITPKDTAQTLQTRLAILGADCLLQSLQKLPTLQANAKTQDHTMSCYAPKIHKSDGLLNWHEPASVLSQRVRAFNPWPVAFTSVGQLRLRIWAADVVQDKNLFPKPVDPGTIVAVTHRAMIVSTGQGYLQITQLQLPGRQCLPISALYHAKPSWLKPGTQLGN